MKPYLKILSILLFIPSFLFSQFSEDSECIMSKVGAKRYINNFNYDTSYYGLTPIKLENSSHSEIKTEFDSKFKYEGNMSLKCEYEFVRQNKVSETEKVRLQKIWPSSFRSDLSFYPLGISIWLNSSGTDDRITINLLQQNDDFTLKSQDLLSFTYSNDTILKKKGWQQIVIPYKLFNPSKINPDNKLELSRVDGYQFDIENICKKPHRGTLHIDAFEQLTSYKPKLEGTPMFTSIFVQLHPSHHEKHDWNSLFKSYLEIGIDTIIIQRSAKDLKDSKLSDFYYNSSDITWKETQYPIIDQMFVEAEKTGMKLILGLHSGKYPLNKGDAEVYNELYNKNEEVLDELYKKFSESEALAGWYICEEFHDGSYRGWWKYEDRMLLANYQQRVAAYAKSKPKKFLVTIAPALWRGRPADMTYEFFRSYFEKTPGIDILYLQDCGGRCSVDEGDFDVILPHWYYYIKKACDETGIQFGVDIESFKRCKGEGVKFHAKKWEYLKNQLIYADIFTKNISQFSWASFRPGIGAFDEYREYLRENGKLRILD